MCNHIVKGFCDEPTGSWQYVFHDPETMKGSIVDPVLDFDSLAWATFTKNADKLLAYLRETGIGLVWVLDTYLRADHFAGLRHRCKPVGGPVGQKTRPPTPSPVYTRSTAIDAAFAKCYTITSSGSCMSSASSCSKLPSITLDSNSESHLQAICACMDAPLIQVISERLERVIGCCHVSGLCVRR